MNKVVRFRMSLGLLTGLAFCFVLCRTLQAQAPEPKPEIRVEKVELSSIGPDRIEASVRLTVIARSTATLRGLVFTEATINGLRVRVPPLQGPIRLQNWHPVEGLPDISAVLTYRELESLEPLKRAVRSGTAEVHAVLSAQVELSLFEKLALLAGGAWVNMTFDQQVPVELPGGGLSRLAALAILTAAEPVWAANRTAQDFLTDRTALAAQVGTSIPGNLVVFETRYELKSRTGETARMRSASCGFLVGKSEVVAPAETVEPWAFDDAIAEALERGDVSVNEKDTDVLAAVIEGADTESSRVFSMQRQEIRIRRKLSASETAISPVTRHPYRIMFRNRDSNAVLLEIPALKDSGSGLAFAAETQGGDWQQAAVVRIDPDRGNKPVLWLTEARREDGRYRIRDIVDPSAVGSPLWVEGGVAGLLQNEGSASDINTLLKRLRP
jgi:hypothetical protein